MSSPGAVGTDDGHATSPSRWRASVVAFLRNDVLAARAVSGGDRPHQPGTPTHSPARDSAEQDWNHQPITCISRAGDPNGERAGAVGRPLSHAPCFSAIHRRNPRPRNVIASKAGLLACGSSRWFRPSRALCESSVTRNGTAAHRSQLRGQRRILPRRTPPASRLSPAACLRRGTSTHCLDTNAGAPSSII